MTWGNEARPVMPRKKKNAQSPARVPGLSNDDTPSSSQSTRGLRGYENAMASNLSMMSRSQKEEIVKNMKEMFSHLDPEIIYIVLSECGFKGGQHSSVPVNFKKGAKQLACLLACGVV